MTDNENGTEDSNVTEADNVVPLFGAKVHELTNAQELLETAKEDGMESIILLGIKGRETHFYATEVDTRDFLLFRHILERIIEEM